MELADVFDNHGPAYRQAHALTETCRTAALGRQVYQQPLEWVLPPLVIAPLGRTDEFRLVSCAAG